MKNQVQGAIVEWRNLLNDAQVLSGPAAQERYGKDTNGIQRQIPAALCITAADSLPAVMKIAQRYGISVYPISTGRNWGYGTAMPSSENCVIIDLSALNKILDFDAELGVINVQPGVTQGILAEFLDAHGHEFMVPVTGAGPACSLIGNALERGFGITPYTDHFSAVTDIEAVLPDGELFRTALHEAGGAELASLFKWGIGPYITGLFTQSGFGIVTRMSILLARRPESVKICLFSLKNDDLLEIAVERIHTLLNKLPSTIAATNLMNQHRMLSMAAPYPTDQLGSDGLIPLELIERMGKQYQILPWTGLMTLYGTRLVVKAAQKEIKRAMAGVASRLIFLTHGQAQSLSRLSSYLPGAIGQRLASTAKTLALSLDLVNGRPNETALPLAYWLNKKTHANESPRNPGQDDCGLIWYAPLIPMRPKRVKAYVEMARAVTIKHGIEPLLTLTSIGDRVFDSTVPILYDKASPIAMGNAKACYDELLEVGRSQGFFPYRLSPDGMRAFQVMHPLSSDMAAKLKVAIDPQGLMAPERYR